MILDLTDDETFPLGKRAQEAPAAIIARVPAVPYPNLRELQKPWGIGN